MSYCNHQLHYEGKPHPRTCAICGIGPCMASADMSNETPATPTSLAEIYDQIREVRTRLAQTRDELTDLVDQAQHLLKLTEQSTDAMEVGLSNMEDAIELLSQEV